MVCQFCAYVFARPGLAHDGRDMCPMCYTPTDEQPEPAQVFEAEENVAYEEAWWDAYVERDYDD